jgi:hypothetical protein
MQGLRNLTGENNCFLNVALQSLWHLNSFRTHMSEHLQKFDLPVRCVSVQSTRA